MKKIPSLLIALWFLVPPVLPLIVSADEEANVMVKLMSSTTTYDSFNAYIQDIYQLILVVAVMLAFLYILWSGVEYINPLSSKKVAKDRFTKAITGLLIVLGTYFLLNMINPEIFNVKLF